MPERAGSPSAEFVCLARAAAHGETKAPKFSDPTALAFLSEEARASLLRLRGGASEPHDQLQHILVRMRSEAVVARTIAVDEAIRAAALSQLVSHRGERGCARPLHRLRARVIDLEDHGVRELAHPPRAAVEPWEGVVPYLTAEQVEGTLAVIRERSAPGSRLAVMYQSPPQVATAPTPASRTFWTSEPLQSWWTPEQMQAQLERAGFRVAFDRDLVDLAAELGADLSAAGERVREGRVVLAART